MESGSHTFVFVGGLPGSGTSLLARCLSEHSLVSRPAGASSAEDARRLRDGLDASSFLTEQSPLAMPETASGLFDEWRADWEDTGPPYLLQRAPENLVRTRFLQALFPQSRFVIVVRDPIAVVGAAQGASRLSELELLEHWLICHERLLADVPGIRHLSLIRYEDLVAAPERVLAEAFGFLGLDAPPEAWRAVEPRTNDAAYEAWQRRRSAWRRRRSYDQVISILESRVARFGYSLARPGDNVFPDRAVDALALKAA